MISREFFVNAGRRGIAQAFGWIVGWIFGRSRSGARDATAGAQINVMGDIPFYRTLEQRDSLLFRRIRSAMTSGNFTQALDLLEKAIAASPNFSDAIEARGETLDMVGESATAAGEYGRSRRLRAAIRPGAPDLSYVLRHRGQFGSEIFSYDLVSRRVKNGLFPLVARGNALLASQRPLEALAEYDRALRIKPRSRELILLRANALLSAGRFIEAISTFDQVLAAGANDADARSGRAIARMATDDVDGANTDWLCQFDLITRERPDARACVALRMADYGRALPELERAVEKYSADPYWRLYCGTASRRLGLKSVVSKQGAMEVWPGPLLGLQAGTVDEKQVLMRADSPDRQAEAAFQLGLLAFLDDKRTAERWWRQVVKQASPKLIEYAAARNELARLGA